MVEYKQIMPLCKILSIDIKTMPQAFGGYHLLLVITYNQTNFMIAVPLRDRTA